MAQNIVAQVRGGHLQRLHFLDADFGLVDGNYYEKAEIPLFQLDAAAFGVLPVFQRVQGTVFQPAGEVALLQKGPKHLQLFLGVFQHGLLLQVGLQLCQRLAGGLFQLLIPHRLDQVAENMGGDGPLGILKGAVARQDDNLGVGPLLGNLLAHGKAVHPQHANVCNHKVDFVGA